MTELKEPYFFGRAYFALRLPPALFSDLPKTIKLGDLELERKEEFHISLLCLKAAVPMIGERIDFSEEQIKELGMLFADYVKEAPITLKRFLPEFRVARKDERTSLVVRVEVENLEGFLQKANSHLDTAIPSVPTHVTLFTYPHDAGIGLNTFPAWEAQERIELPELFIALGK